MKTVLIAGLFALTTAVSSVALAATDNSAQGTYADRYVQRMTSELKLTPGQEEQMLELHTQHAEKIQALRKEQQKEVEALLNDEQRKQFQTMREQRRGKSMHDRRDGQHHYGDCNPASQPDT